MTDQEALRIKCVLSVYETLWKAADDLQAARKDASKVGKLTRFVRLCITQGFEDSVDAKANVAILTKSDAGTHLGETVRRSFIAWLHEAEAAIRLELTAFNGSLDSPNTIKQDCDAPLEGVRRRIVPSAPMSAPPALFMYYEVSISDHGRIAAKWDNPIELMEVLSLIPAFGAAISSWSPTTSVGDVLFLNHDRGFLLRRR